VDKLTVCEVTSNQLPQCPLLEDVLQHYGQRAFLNIELKVCGLEPSVLAAVRECPPHRGYAVSSFLPEVVMELKVRSGTIPVGIICEKQAQLAKWRQLPVEYVIVEKNLISKNLVEEVHLAGRRLFAWTVNHPEAMLRFASWGVDAIISDETEMMVRTFAGKSDGRGERAQGSGGLN